MRTLLLFRGAPGCGKSTFIKENDLQKYTVSADDLRLLMASPQLTLDGSPAISAANDKKVWNYLFQFLELRMRNGDFTVVDATQNYFYGYIRELREADPDKFRNEKLSIIDYRDSFYKAMNERGISV